MKYIVVGPSIINDVELTDGTIKKSIIGGSIYCVAGIKLWCDDCLYISNVGYDFSKYYGEWMENNKCSYSGLKEILPHTQYTLLKYGKDGIHTEKSIYGSKEEELINILDKHDINNIYNFCNKDTKGIYIEANEMDDIWDNLDKIKTAGNITVMWELPTSVATQPERKKKTIEVIKKVSIYSINFPEAKVLFNANNINDIIDLIIKLDIPCYLRYGKNGSYMICNNNAYFSESINLGEVVDTTGCGNCSTAAALYGYCEGYNPERIALIGNISAGYNLLQYGPFPNVVSKRNEAYKFLET
ncbi:MAG: PfkB family carbohydrate kinase [Bacteroidales bacterium]|jgi:sugar/nucleoside kinase (ribokinase family)|nr:PfkB family carbohydrate kinase [Bacteroidales bacterium]